MNDREVIPKLKRQSKRNLALSIKLRSQTVTTAPHRRRQDPETARPTPLI